MLIPSLIGIALIGYGAMALICRDADKLFMTNVVSAF